MWLNSSAVHSDCRTPGRSGAGLALIGSVCTIHYNGYQFLQGISNVIFTNLGFRRACTGRAGGTVHLALIGWRHVKASSTAARRVIRAVVKWWPARPTIFDARRRPGGGAKRAADDTGSALASFPASCHPQLHLCRLPMAPSRSDDRPVLLLTASPFVGHVTPMRTIAASLVHAGYPVYLLTGANFEENVKAAGATFLPLPPAADVDDPQLDAQRLGIQWKPDVLDQMAEYFEKCTIGAHMDPQIDALQAAIAQVRAAHPGRPLIALNDVWFFGSVAVMAGAPGARPDAWIGIGVVPIGLSSKDCAPWGPGELPDPSPQGHARDEAILERSRAAFAGAQTRYEEILTRRGAKRVSWFWDEAYLLPERFIQLSLPSLEWPRTDAPDTIRFSGGLPRTAKKTAENTAPAAAADRPSWWGDLARHRQNRGRVVAVSQGTLDVDLQQLVLPTIEALADDVDVLLVVALGKKDRTLPPGTRIPHNVRVEGWIPYDALLPEVDAFITNGGYGSLQHAVTHGVPLVIAGGSMDKAEVAARAEWAGLGVNLRTATPGPELIKDAVDEVLEDENYTKIAKQLQQDSESADPLAVIVETIEKLA